MGGAFISCEMPLQPNEKVFLDYGDHPKKMQDIAQVVWTNLESKGTRDKPTGMGVQFLVLHSLWSDRNSPLIHEMIASKIF